MLCRYQIQYTVSDAKNVAAMPLTISITFVEVALVTGSFLFIGQADNATEAQQQALQLTANGTVSNAAVTTAVASVFQGWLASATSTYVDQLTSTLGSAAATVAATNTLELGLFSSVLTTDVTVVNATIDQNTTSVLNVNSSDAVQNYAYNVTLQVAVLTADMLLSIFVDVLNSTYTRRRLLSSSALSWIQPTEHSEVSVPVQSSFAGEQPLSPSLPAVHQQGQRSSSGSEVITTQQPQLLQVQVHTADSLQHAPQATVLLQPPSQSSLISDTLTAVLSSAAASAHRRSLRSTSSSTPFPLASLLQFKMDLVLAAFTATSGCSTDSLTELFYGGSEAPDSLSELCGGYGGGTDLSLNQALLAAVNSSVPLLQVWAAPCTSSLHASATEACATWACQPCL